MSNPIQMATVFTAAIFFSVFQFAEPLGAQEASPGTGSGRSIRFIPPDAMFVGDLRPRELLTDESAWFLPTEVIQAACNQYVGVQAENIESVRIVGPMVNPQFPAVGVVIEFTKDVSLEDLKPGLIEMDNVINVAGRSCYAVANADGMVVIHAATARRWMIGTPSYLPAMFEAGDDDGGLQRRGGNAIADAAGSMARIVQSNPKRGIVQIAIDIKPLRPLIMAAIMANADEIPPVVGRLPEIVNLIDSVTSTTEANLVDLMTYGSWTLYANDEAAANQLEMIIEQTVDDLATMGVSMAMQSIEGDDEVSQSLRTYIRRLEQQIVPMLRLKRDGVKFHAPSVDVQTVGTIGVLTGLLLPAVQASREAARRMSASNNLKMIGLAMHNYHAAYGKLPPRAITAEDGTPLLSWRVAILPFMEEQVLYERFHLDEPWDSPHNLPLAELMPEVFVDPSIPNLGNQTVFLSPDGEGTMLGTVGQDRRFRDILDGLSNTIFVIEASSDQAVVWSKPQDVVVPSDDPFFVTGDAHPGGFHVSLGDGAVIFITNVLDPETLNAMITAAGREVVQF